jgi:hypothetical protein
MACLKIEPRWFVALSLAFACASQAVTEKAMAANLSTRSVSPILDPIAADGPAPAITTAQIATSMFPPDLTAFTTSGWSSPGDGGGAPWVRGKGCPAAGRISSADGQCWTIANRSNLTVLDFGAIGDSTTDDTAAIQACLDFVAPPPGSNIGGECHLPKGGYYISSSLKIPNFVTFSGEGPGSILTNQYVALAAPQVINQNAGAALYIAFRNMTFRGGTYAVAFTASSEVANITFDNVVMDLQTVGNITTNRGFEVSTFNNLEWDDAPTGITSPYPTNGNNWFGGLSQNHSGPHIDFGTSSDNNFYGTVFQGGGVAGRSTILLREPTNFNLDGVYAEGTHTYLLTETGSTNTTTVQHSHFTGANTGGGFIPYQWSSDGVVNFGTNSWHTPSNGPTKMAVIGENQDRLGNNNQTTYVSSRPRKDVVSSDLTVTSTVNDLVTISRAGRSGAPSNVQNLTGTLTIGYIGVSRSGFVTVFSRRYLVDVYCIGAAPMVATIHQMADASTPYGGDTLAVAVVGTPTDRSLTIGETFSSGVPRSGVSGAPSAQEKIEFDYMASSSTTVDYMTAALAF